MLRRTLSRISGYRNIWGHLYCLPSEMKTSTDPNYAVFYMESYFFCSWDGILQPNTSIDIHHGTSGVLVSRPSACQFIDIYTLKTRRGCSVRSARFSLPSYLHIINMAVQISIGSYIVKRLEEQGVKVSFVCLMMLNVPTEIRLVVYIWSAWIVPRSVLCELLFIGQFRRATILNYCS